MRRFPLGSLAAIAVALCITGCGGPPPTPAERLAEQYFEVVGRQAYDEALPLYSELFFEKTPREQWKQSLADVQRSMGEPLSHRLQRPLQPAEEGPDGSYRQTLVYVVQYKRYKAEETITVFQAPSGGPLRILEHNIRYLES